MTFRRSSSVVTLPTPPGTGLSAPATAETLATSTSPTIPCGVTLMPASITVAPLRSMSPVRNPARPTDDWAAPDDHRARSAKRDLVELQQFDDRLGGRRDEARMAGGQQSRVRR